jgi:hypothetical protein
VSADATLRLAAEQENRVLAQRENDEQGAFEYGERKVFLVEDGERHWYVAEDAGDALSAHILLMEADSDEYSVSFIEPSRKITVDMESADDCLGFPSTFVILGPLSGADEHRERWGVRARASEWARHHEEGEQICSSVC